MADFEHRLLTQGIHCTDLTSRNTWRNRKKIYLESTILIWRSLVKAIEHKDIVHILKEYIIVIIFFT